MGSALVVFVDKVVDEMLELVDCVGLGCLGFQPFFECLVESFDFAAGGGAVWSGVFLVDSEGDELCFETVAALLVACESGGVDENVVGEY